MGEISGQRLSRVDPGGQLGHFLSMATDRPPVAVRDHMWSGVATFGNDPNRCPVPDTEIPRVFTKHMPMATIHLVIPPALEERMDKVLNLWGFQSKAELFRHAVTIYLNEMEKLEQQRKGKFTQLYTKAG